MILTSEVYTHDLIESLKNTVYDNVKLTSSANIIELLYYSRYDENDSVTVDDFYDFAIVVNNLYEPYTRVRDFILNKLIDLFVYSNLFDDTCIVRPKNLIYHDLHFLNHLITPKVLYKGYSTSDLLLINKIYKNTYTSLDDFINKMGYILKINNIIETEDGQEKDITIMNVKNFKKYKCRIMHDYYNDDYTHTDFWHFVL